MATGETVRYEVSDHIARITLNRPDKKNAINRAMRKEIEEACTDVKYNPDIWLAIIAAEGDVFCAGKDILETLPEDGGSVMSNDAFYLFLRHIYKPVVCAIGGPCLAQGGGFALNSDIVIMSERASIGWPQVMRGEFIPAAECCRLGLANGVVSQEELLPAADRWAAEILESAPLAVRVIKEAARRGQELPFEDRVYMARDVANRILHSEDSKEGVLAFREKRKSIWRGR